jgi:multiple sugar transport system ATP-binding protein
MAEVVLKDLTKIFDNKVRAVSNVNLSISDREFLVLVGPSGCGKTTILRMVAGLEQATSGEISIGGTLVNQVPPKDRNVAMVFQNYALYPHMSVYDNIAFGLRMQKVPKQSLDQKVRQTAALLSIDKYLDRKPRALSGGQRQRVALARAIVKSPKVFLFDEPLSNLDAQLRTQTRAELKRLQQQLGTTAIYVTHDRTEAMTLGDRIAVVRDGVLQQVDEPLAIYQRPQNLFVANFIGTPGINILKGELFPKTDKLEFRCPGFTMDISVLKETNLKPGPVYLGFRPEDGRLVGEGEPGIKGQVDLVEQLGGESLVYLSGSEDRKMIVKTLGNLKLDQGSNAGVTFDPFHAHIFDYNTEQRLN